ncbi:opsin 9 [Megalops cyprinoides]|uniref:opsin 9 n=1 Tax=Megalops cyprinoides TaxID=118141 RepID=UPI0018647903|nr:opsin 9 [Megalops cyprinoides]
MSSGLNASWRKSLPVPSSFPSSFLSHLAATTDVAVSVFLIITGTVSILGNGVVLLVFSRKRTHLRPPELMTINLAICDFGYSLLGAPFLIYSSLSHAWVFGEAGCMWYGIQGSVFGIGSLITTCLISLERCLKICSFRYGQWIERRHVAMSVGLVWIYTIFWASLPLVGFGSYGPEPFGTSCTINWWRLKSSLNDRIYICLTMTLCFAIPALTMIASYIIILLTVHRSGRSLASIPSSAVSHSKKDLRLTRIAAVVCSTFLIAWTPYAIVSIYSALVVKEEQGGDTGVQRGGAGGGVVPSMGEGDRIPAVFSLSTFFNWSSAENTHDSHSSKNTTHDSHPGLGSSPTFSSDSPLGSHSPHPVSDLPPELTLIPAMLAKSHCMINPFIYQIMNKEFREDVYYMFCARGRESERRRWRGRETSYTEGNRGSISLSYCHSWSRKSTNTTSSAVETTSKRDTGSTRRCKGTGGYWQDNQSVGETSVDVPNLDTQVNLDRQSGSEGESTLGREGHLMASSLIYE